MYTKLRATVLNYGQNVCFPTDLCPYFPLIQLKYLPPPLQKRVNYYTLCYRHASSLNDPKYFIELQLIDTLKIIN